MKGAQYWGSLFAQRVCSNLQNAAVCVVVSWESIVPNIAATPQGVGTVGSPMRLQVAPLTLKGKIAPPDKLIMPLTMRIAAPAVGLLPHHEAPSTFGGGGARPAPAGGSDMHATQFQTQ